MALVVVNGGYPRISDKAYYDGSVSPTVDNYWAVAMGSAPAIFILDPSVFNVAVPTARSWWVFEHKLATSHALDQNKEFVILDGGNWEVRGQAEDANPPSYFKVRLYDSSGLLGEGSTELAVGSDHYYRHTWLSGQTSLEVNGTYEINTATSDAIPTYSTFHIGGNTGEASPSGLVLWNFIAFRGDSSSDRPSAVPTDRVITAIVPDSAGAPTYTGWTGTDDDFDDWRHGNHDGDATFIVPPSTSTVKETAVPLAVPTLSKTAQAYWQRHRIRLTGSPGGTKDVGSALIYENVVPDERAVSLGRATSTAYFTRSVLFTKAPDNAAWDQDALDGLEIGVSGANFDASIKLYHTAIAGTFFECDVDAGDPPTLAVTFPRVLPATRLQALINNGLVQS